MKTYRHDNGLHLVTTQLQEREMDEKIRIRLLEKVREFPDSPGIYKFYSKGEIVYVGKSLHLRSRVRSYFSKKHERSKLYVMMCFIDDIDYETTDTHLEARLLEFRMIRQLQPLYNAQYKRRRAQYYLQLGEKEVLNLSLAEGIGPFSGSRFLRNMKKHWVHLFPISFENDEFHFSFQPFALNLSPRQISATTDSLNLVFNDRTLLSKFYKQIEEKMYESSKELHFRQAQYYKNILQNLKYLRIQLFEKRAFYAGKWILQTEGYYLFIEEGIIQYKLSENQLQQKYSSIGGSFEPDFSLLFRKEVQLWKDSKKENRKIDWSIEEKEIVYSEYRIGNDRIIPF